MAVTYTVTNTEYLGRKKMVTGTFTSETGDGAGETIAYATHGLNSLVDYGVFLDPGGIATPLPKITVSAGTLTWTVDDTQGYSGRWTVTGA